MSSEKVDNEPIFHTPEEVFTTIPRPDLPVIKLVFSIDSNGKIIPDGGSGYMNGQPEDILKAIGPVAIATYYGHPPALDENTFQISFFVSSATDIARELSGYDPIPEIRYVGPQAEVHTDDNGNLAKPQIRRAVIKLLDGEANTFEGLLRPETKRKKISEKHKGYGEIVVVEL